MTYQRRLYTTIHNTIVLNIGGSNLDINGMIENHKIHGKDKYESFAGTQIKHHENSIITVYLKVISHNLNFAYFEHYLQYFRIIMKFHTNTFLY